MKKLIILTLALVQASLACAQDFSAHDATRTTPYSISVSIKGDPSERVGFLWITNRGVDGQKLQLVPKANATDADFASTTLVRDASVKRFAWPYFSHRNTEMVEKLALPADVYFPYNVNRILWQGLIPNTTYSYRMGKEGAWGPVGTFTTAPDPKEKQPFSFLFFTDTQASRVEQFELSQRTIHAAAAKYPDSKFIMILGDMINTGVEWEWEQWFSTNQDVWSKFLFVPVIGNHDYSEDKIFSYHFNTSNEYDRDDMAPVKPFTPGTNYSFVYGDALFMMLNFEDFTEEGYLESVAGWMERVVAEHPDTKWRIVGFHKTMYTGGTGHQRDEDIYKIRETMTPVFRNLHIDLALQGHDHVYEVIGPVDADQRLVRGAVTNRKSVPVDAKMNVTGVEGGTFDVTNGTLFALLGRAGSKAYLPFSKQEMEESYPIHRVNDYYSLFTGKFGQNDQPTFSNISVSDERIEIETFTVDEAGNTHPWDKIEIVK